MRAEELLRAGFRILDPLMTASGFEVGAMSSANSSGGASASGEFRRGHGDESRRLELHFRQSLGLVTYHLGGVSLSHGDYMRALGANNRYPGFSDDPLDGFRHLLHDLEHYARDFLSGPGDEFLRCAREQQPA
jgi:hypothetical protein